MLLVSLRPHYQGDEAIPVSRSTSDPMPDPTKLADDLKAWAQGLQQQAERYGELQSKLDATSVTRTSPDGTVRVTVDSKGVPTELTITERGQGAPVRELSAALMATMRQAQAQLRDTVAALTAETVGDDGPGTDIVAGYREQFPDPVEGAIGADGAEGTDGTDGGTHDIGALEDETADYGGAEPHDSPTRPTSRPARDDRREDDDTDDDFGGSIFR